MQISKEYFRKRRGKCAVTRQPKVLGVMFPSSCIDTMTAVVCVGHSVHVRVTQWLHHRHRHCHRRGRHTLLRGRTHNRRRRETYQRIIRRYLRHNVDRPSWRWHVGRDMSSPEMYVRRFITAPLGACRRYRRWGWVNKTRCINPPPFTIIDPCVWIAVQ